MTPSISKAFNLNSIAITFVCVLTIGLFWIYDHYKKTQQEIDTIDSTFIEEQKIRIRQDVTQVINNIDYTYRVHKRVSLDNMKERVNDAYLTAQRIYEMHRDTKGIDEIKGLVKDVLRSIRFNEGRGYYFATSMNGIEELFPDRPELEGKNLYSMRDTSGRYVIRDMIHIARTKGEGFYEYTWTKPNNRGNHFNKVSYIKYFKPFDWFIGTGEYADDLEHSSMQEILQWIQHVKVADDNYVFVFNLEGLCLAHPNRQWQGRNMLDSNNEEARKIVSEIVKIGREKGEGFLSYKFIHKEDMPPMAKISFVKTYKKLDWIIGAGFYTERLNEQINIKKAALREAMYRQVFIMLSVMCCIFGAVLLANQFFLMPIKEGFKTFVDFFKHSVDLSAPLETKRLHFSEFKDLALSLNRMIERKITTEAALEETRQDYKAMFDSMIDAFALHEMIYDNDNRPIDYRFITVNPAFERFTGLRSEDIVGRTVLEIMPDTEPYWIEAYGRVVETGEPINFENYSGSIGRYFEVTAYKHGPDKFACIFVDVTERVVMHKNLQELTRNLEEKVHEEVEKRRRQEVMLIQQSKHAAMAEMLVSISHHWRQPLNAIGLVVQSLEDSYQRGQIDETYIKWVIGTVMDRLNQMSSTINAFSSYFHKMAISDSFELKAALRNTFALISEYLSAHNIRWEIYCSRTKTTMSDVSQVSSCSEVDELVKGDLSGFQQVLLSLLNNAKDSIIQRKNNVALSGVNDMDLGFIRAIIDGNDSSYIIRIEDNGAGIPEGIRDRIFDPYFTTKDSSITVGLGLYMSKIIIEEHMKGRLYLDNYVSKGAAFVIELKR